MQEIKEEDVLLLNAKEPINLLIRIHNSEAYGLVDHPYLHCDLSADEQALHFLCRFIDPFLF